MYCNFTSIDAQIKDWHPLITWFIGDFFFKWKVCNDVIIFVKWWVNFKLNIDALGFGIKTRDILRITFVIIETHMLCSGIKCLQMILEPCPGYAPQAPMLITMYPDKHWKPHGCKCFRVWNLITADVSQAKHGCRKRTKQHSPKTSN